MNTDDKVTGAELRKVLASLSASDRSFANSLLAGLDQYGYWTQGRREWALKLLARAGAEACPIGDMGGIMELFDKARLKIARPSIELMVPSHGAIHFSVAGSKSKHPGSITIATAEKYDDGGEWPGRRWLGRVTRNGSFVPSELLCADKGYHDAVVDRLKAFAENPVKVAGDDGKLLGRCCFCRGALRDERSTMVGYGKTCARSFSLPWGERPGEASLFASPAA